MSIYTYHPGKVPVLVNMPHTSTHVPPSLFERFTAPARKMPDTDWHIDRLYSFARDLGVHMLIPTHSRYVVDLNRGEGNESLYPGRFTTGVCPSTLFDGTPIYEKGREPDHIEIAERLVQYWQPYHARLISAIEDMRKQHGRVAVLDAHSICSQVPLLFDGVLPDLNIGTADGASADTKLCDALVAIAKDSGYSVAYNGRFKGGYITRHYGRPQQGVQVVQLELAQKNYMDEHYPFAYNEVKATRLQEAIGRLLACLIKEVSQ